MDADDGPIGELHVGLKGTMNALHLKDLAQKTHRGREGRVRSGMSGGGICYGYDLVSGHTGASKINQTQAAVVVRIYEEHTAGKSPGRSPCSSTRSECPALGADPGAIFWAALALGTAGEIATAGGAWRSSDGINR